MNTSETTEPTVTAGWGGQVDPTLGPEPALPAGRGIGQRAAGFLGDLVIRVFRGEQRSPSILRNNTNLPVFLALAVGISLICNFALKENTVQASRFLGSAATLKATQELVARHPEDPSLHSRLGELHLQQNNLKRAMFHFRESTRLNELFGE